MTDKIDLLEHKNEFCVRPLKQDTDVSSFCADNDVFTKCLKEVAKKYEKDVLTTTYLIYKVGEDKNICGYFSLMFSNIRYDRDMGLDIPKCIEDVGALSIYYLVSSRDFAERCCHVVKSIIGFVKTIALDLSKYVKVRYIILDADSDTGSYNIVEIYGKAGFKRLKTSTTPEAVQIFLDIYA